MILYGSVQVKAKRLIIENVIKTHGQFFNCQLRRLKEKEGRKNLVEFLALNAQNFASLFCAFIKIRIQPMQIIKNIITKMKSLF